MTIRVATRQDVRVGADVIATAFADLRACAWLEPDADHRRCTLRDVFALTVEHALDHGVVHLLTPPDGQLAGVAVWLDSTRPLPPPPDYDRRLRIAAGTNTAAFAHLDSLFAAHHPEPPHHYLALLAALPERQRTGIGSALLEHHHRVLDEQQVPAYLEAADPRSRRLYERHGYERSADDFTLPNGAAFTPMWRRSRRCGGPVAARPSAAPEFDSRADPSRRPGRIPAQCEANHVP